MKKIRCMIALIAISFSSVYAETPVNISVNLINATIHQQHKKPMKKSKKPMKMKKGTSMGNMKM